jgi:hypothetical protein
VSNPRVEHPGYHGHRALLRVLFGPTGQRPDWQQNAACTGSDTDQFFTTATPAAEQARQVCTGCPVLAQCRADQLTWEARTSQFRAYTAGVVGGMTAKERQALHTASRAARAVA